jgi:hypothetical protein
MDTAEDRVDLPVIADCGDASTCVKLAGALLLSQAVDIFCSDLHASFKYFGSDLFMYFSEKYLLNIREVNP